MDRHWHSVIMLPQVASDRKQKSRLFWRSEQRADHVGTRAMTIAVRSGVAVTLQMGVDGAQIAGGGRSAQIQPNYGHFSLNSAVDRRGDAKVDGLKPEDAKVLDSVVAGTAPLIITGASRVGYFAGLSARSRFQPEDHSRRSGGRLDGRGQDREADCLRHWSTVTMATSARRNGALAMPTHQG